MRATGKSKASRVAHALLAALPLLFLQSSGVTAQDFDKDESAVWALEYKYYEFAKDNDPDGYLTLFHEDVIGWPTLDHQPKGKDKVSQWIASVHADPNKIWDYEITQLATQSFGDVVVVHYLLREYFVSAATGGVIQSDRYRISHTWLRNGDTWQIISGMGGRFN